MKLLYKHWNTGKILERSIADAVADHCDSFESAGAVEDARHTAREAAQGLGKLVEKLHDKGVLSSDDVLGFINQWNYEIQK